LLCSFSSTTMLPKSNQFMLCGCAYQLILS
jgi:hypothetical protein